MRAMTIASLCLAAACSALGSEAAPVRLTIRVVDASTDAGLRDAYVAVYAPEDPWRRPSHEMIAANGAGAFPVGPGRYQILAGARGFQSTVRRIEVAAEPTQSTIALAPDLHVSGIVYDAAGSPIRGARVSQVRLPLSDLAQERLAHSWRTTTDENGWWSLPATGEFVVPLVIEANGFAPAWREIQPSDQGKSIDVMLRNGGGLRLVLDRADPELVLTLAAAGDAEVGRGWQKQIWTRAASARTVEWDALAEGSYKVVIESGDPRRFVSSDVATVRITAHGIAEHRVSLPRAKPASVLTLFVPRKPATDLTRVAGWQRARGGGVQKLDAVTETAAGGTLIHLATAAAPREVFATTASHLIVPADRPHAKVIPSAIHDRGEATLRIAAANEAQELPAAGEVALRDCEGNESIALPIDIAKNGGIALPAPAECRTLIVRAPPFETFAVPLAVRKGETRFLGVFPLEAAGEAEIRVRWAPSGNGVAGATVRALLPLQEREAIVAEGVADESGVVVMRGLPAGENLRIDAHTERASSRGESPLLVGAGQRALIDPLAVPEPARVIVRPRLTARFRELHPDARIVALSLAPEVRTAKRDPRSDSLGERETVEFGDLAPGRWSLRAIVEHGAQAQPIDAGAVELAAGETREWEPAVEPLIFRGRVHGSESYARWSVSIADPPAWDAIRRRVQLAADGTFVAVIPRRGTYHVGVHTGDPHIREVAVGEIAFSDPNQVVDIELPQASLIATVRDQGKPVARAKVTLRLRRDSRTPPAMEIAHSAETDIDGVARFRMLPEGDWLARARSETGRIAERVVAVSRDAVTDVGFDLASAHALAGVVHHANGQPAALSTIECISTGNTGPRVERGAADRDGRFALELTTASAVLRCSVTSREGIVGAYLLRPSTSADLTLPAAGTPLVLSDWFDRVPSNDFWLLSPDGRVVGVMAVAGTLGRIGAPVVIPNYPAGSWKLLHTRTHDEWSMVASGYAGSANVVADLHLEPGRPARVEIWKTTKGASK